MIRRPPRSTLSSSSAASDVYKRQANYRPISNLTTVSKVLERLVLARLRPHLTNSANFSKRQSSYRQGHSTETALVDILESVYTAADNKEITVLIGLDLSAAFDTIDHDILITRLSSWFGIHGSVLSWFKSTILRHVHHSSQYPHFLLFPKPSPLRR